MQSDWYRDFFHGVALDLWRKAIKPEYTRAEAELLVDALAARPGSRLLDVPCGNGRLALELARRGCAMTGLDISQEFLEEARRSARQARLEVEWLLGDMRELSRQAEFDGAFCVGNSFGYMEHAGNLEFLMRIGRALKAGGRFVLEIGAAAESLLPHLQERTWYRFDELSVMIENRYQVAEGRLETEYTFVRDGAQETRRGAQAVYTAAELRRMLAAAGLETVAIYGGVDRKPFELGSHQLILVTEKCPRSSA